MLNWLRRLRRPPNPTNDVELNATVGTSTRWVAEKIPGPAPEPVQVHAADAGLGGERAVVEPLKPGTRSPSAIRIQDSQVPHSSAADLDELGQISYRLEGAPEQGEEGTARAAALVVEKMNADGAHWSGVTTTPRNAKLERGVDAVATGADGSTLEIQVVRAERGLWENLARHGVVEGSLTVEEASEALWLSVETKRLRVDRNVVLILDAVNVGQFALGPITQMFRERRGVEAVEVGFKEIWLAAPTAERTVRLDVPARYASSE
jgi:hypothetical protein